MIIARGLTKRYGDVVAVDDADLVARSGEVTGFLGPNGSGKSTTLRMLTGLTEPDRGSATIGGHRFRDLPNPGRLVGVILDASAQHPGRTGREALTLGARTMGVDPGRVDEVLELVDLSQAAARRRIRDYSLGMRQRLGVGHALLGDPPVLILDEPANGLDPAGIRWMRGLLRGHAERGGTVLLSSHLLHEVEQTADHLVVIGRGRVVASGRKSDLVAAIGTYVSAGDNEQLAAALRAAGAEPQPSGDGLLVELDAARVGELALAAGLALTELRSSGASSLEDLFLGLTADPDPARNPAPPPPAGPPSAGAAPTTEVPA